MKYWEDMQDKYGFNGGDTTPNGTDEYRQAYLLAVNAFAERFGSAVRYVAWDRPGMHNGCLVICVPVADADNAFGADRPYPTNGEAKPDDAMERAISAAIEMNVDPFVQVEVRLTLEAQAEIVREAGLLAEFSS